MPTEINSIEVSLGKHELKLTFSSWVEAQEWLAKEKMAWQWVKDQYYQVSSQFQQSINVLNAFHEGLESKLSNAIHEKLEIKQIPDVFGEFASEFENVLFSRSPDGLKVLDIRVRRGDKIGAIVYAFASNMLLIGQIEKREQFQAVLEFCVPTDLETEKLREALNNERLEFELKLKTLDAALNAGEKEREQNFNLWCEHRGTWFQELVSDMKAAMTTQKADWQAELEEGKRNLEAITEQYRTFSELSSAESYWKTEAKNHTDKEGRLLWALAGYFVLSPLVLIGIYWVSHNYLTSGLMQVDDKSRSVILYFISGGLLVLTTIIFWIGRLISRMYLSEKHLGTDAGQRAVMTKTYLALIPEDRLDIDSRQMILAALFRPTSDGVVKDEGADSSLAMWLSRVGMPK